MYFVTRFLYAIILARIFGPRVYGMISYGIAWYLLFLPLTRIGLEVVLSRDVGEDHQKGAQTAAITFTLRIITIVLATAAYLILSWSIESEQASRLMVFAFAIALIGRSMAGWVTSVYTAYEVSQYSFRQQSFFRPLEFFLGLAAAIIWREAIWVILIHGLVWCLEAVYGLRLIHCRLFPLRVKSKFFDLYHIFMQGLPLGAAMLLMTLQHQGPLIFFRNLVPAGDSLGQLALAMQVFSMLANIPLALGNASLPALSRAAARLDGKDRLFAETSLRFSLLFGTILSLIGAALGPWLTVLIFSERYAQAGTLIGPVLWLMVPWGAGYALARVLMARKLDRQTFLCALAGAGLFSLTISEAVMRYGATGAIWSAGMGMTLTALCLIFVLHTRLAIDLRVSLIRPGLTALAATGFYYSLSSMGQILPLLGAFGVLAISCRVFACLTPQDIIWFEQTYRWLTKKIMPTI